MDREQIVVFLNLWYSWGPLLQALQFLEEETKDFSSLTSSILLGGEFGGSDLFLFLLPRAVDFRPQALSSSACPGHGLGYPSPSFLDSLPSPCCRSWLCSRRLDTPVLWWSCLYFLSSFGFFTSPRFTSPLISAIRLFPLMWVCVSVCIPRGSDPTWGWMVLIPKQIPCAEWSPALEDSNFPFTLAFCPWVAWTYPCSSLVFSFTVVQRCIAQETAETCTQPIGSPGYQIPGKGVVVGSRSTLWPSSLGGRAPVIF